MLFLFLDIIRYLTLVPLGMQYISGNRSGQREMIDFLLTILEDFEFSASTPFPPPLGFNLINQHNFIDQVCELYIFFCDQWVMINFKNK